MLNDGKSYGKHSAVIAAIHKDFVRPGRLPTQCGRDLNRLFELRATGDYGISVHVTRDEAERAIAAAREFVRAARSLLP